MKHLADACALIVFYGGGPARARMSAGLEIIEGSATGVLATTVREITRKVSLGKLEAPCGGSLTRLLLRDGFVLTPFTWEDAEAANALPDHHRDPMDRMLIAVALRTDMTVITSDRIFAQYGVRTVW